MTQNKFLTIILTLLVLAIGTIVNQSIKVQRLKGDLEIRKIDLKRKDVQIKMKIDSIQLAKKHSIERDSVWSQIVKDQLGQLVIERAKTEKMKIKYVKLKNAPVPLWTNADLDSLLESVIR